MEEADPAAEPPLKRVRWLGLPACHHDCRGQAAAMHQLCCRCQALFTPIPSLCLLSALVDSAANHMSKKPIHLLERSPLTGGWQLPLPKPCLPLK